MKVQDKVIVVTGAGNGIGRELVQSLLSKGARVAAVDIASASLEQTAALASQHRDRLASHVLSVADRPAVEMLPEQVIARFGAVDGVINNAGTSGPLETHSLRPDILTPSTRNGPQRWMPSTAMIWFPLPRR